MIRVTQLYPLPLDVKVKAIGLKGQVRVGAVEPICCHVDKSGGKNKSYLGGLESTIYCQNIKDASGFAFSLHR